MKNFGKVIDNFDAVTKQYVDNKVPTDEHIKGIKVDNATLADTAKKVQNAFTYKAHNKAAGTVVPITYDGSEAASLDFSADDFAPVYTSGKDLGLKLVDKGYATKTYVDNQDALKLDKAGGSITGNLTVGGNLTINGTTTTVDSTTLQVKDKLIEVAHGNTTTLTTPAGLVAPKYDGTNSGALVFDSTGTAYVGDVTFKDGNIDVANSGLQPLATRTGLVGGNLVQYDSSALTLKDSGKKIGDLALKTDIPNTAKHSSKQLATNTDLNTLNSSDDIGWYHVGGGNSCAHKPTGVDAFGLEVGRSAGGWFYQVLTSSNNAASRGRRFMRTYTGTAWDAWKKVAITSDIPAVHDGTLTIQKNGTAVATFTANSALNTIANIKVPSTFDDLSRIKKQDYAGNNNAVKYFKLATFPVYNSDGNYASFIITGRMGGWESGNTSFVNMILYNRNGEGGGYINVANSSFFNLCDIVMYREADGTSTAYLKVKGYYTFDINVNTYQATNVYTGTDVPPTGTLKWTASANADRLAVSGGKVYVNGFMMPKQVRINDTVRTPDANAVIDLGTVPVSYTTSSLTP